MNEHIKNNKYFAAAKEFRDKIDEFFSQTRPKIADILGRSINDNLGLRMNDNFQLLNSAY